MLTVEDLHTAYFEYSILVSEHGPNPTSLVDITLWEALNIDKAVEDVIINDLCHNQNGDTTAGFLHGFTLGVYVGQRMPKGVV